jgi:hypothetical protein
MNLWKVTTFLLLLALAVVGGAAMADRGKPQPQPLMRTALASLREAKVSLQNATHDKGGHRVKALEHVNAAIDEVQKGIDYDDKHH